MRRHPFDLLSFLAGVLFIALGIVALQGPLTLTTLDPDILLPIAAMAVGVGILLTLRPGRGSGASPDHGADADTEAGTDTEADTEADREGVLHPEHGGDRSGPDH